MPTSALVGGDGLPLGSASSIISGVVSGYHLLKIVGYSGTKEVPNGKHVDSCPFQAGGHTWLVSYYPDGSGSEYIDYIGLFLSLDDTVDKAETVKAKFKFSLLDQHGKPVPSYTRTCKKSDFSVDKCLGFARFMKRAELEESEHLKDDSFTIKLDVTIMRECHTQEAPSVLVPPSDMHQHFGDLLSSKAGVDVEFFVGGETFSARRLVLAARSPVFRAELFGLMREEPLLGPYAYMTLRQKCSTLCLLLFIRMHYLLWIKRRNLPWPSICLLQQTGMLWRG